MRIAYLRVKIGFRFGDLPSFLLLASTLAIAQSNPRALVSKMVENELESQKHPRYWMYLDSKTRPGRTEVSRVIQVPECWITWPVAIDGHPPTEEERKRAREQVEKLESSVDCLLRSRRLTNPTVIGRSHLCNAVLRVVSSSRREELRFSIVQVRPEPSPSLLACV
jgi:hypothetical protein